MDILNAKIDSIRNTLDEKFNIVLSRAYVTLAILLIFLACMFLSIIITKKDRSDVKLPPPTALPGR